MHDGGGIKDLAATRHGEAEHVDRRRSARVLGEPLELLTLSDQEPRPLHQVLGRVAADRLFGKRADGDVRGGHLLRDGDEPRHVRPDRANRGTHACYSQFGQAHI
jgi:hypothetical protein